METRGESGTVTNDPNLTNTSPDAGKVAGSTAALTAGTVTNDPQLTKSTDVPSGPVSGVSKPASETDKKMTLCPGADKHEPDPLKGKTTDSAADIKTAKHEHKTKRHSLQTKKNEAATPADFKIPDMTEKTIFKNVLVLSVAFLFLFAAFNSMANLQTSLNKEQGVGAYSLSSIYVAIIVSCIFLPKFVIARLGCKWTIPLSMIGYALYMAANFYPVIWLMTLAGIILGLGAAPMWAAKCTYLTQLGVWYSRLTKQSEDAVINKFFGFFFMVFQTSQIWGHLVASIVLKKRPPVNDSSTEKTVCGANFTPTVETDHTGFKQPEELVRSLCIVYLGCTIIGIAILSLLLDPIKLDTELDNKLSVKLLWASGKHLISSPEQMLLVPLTIYSGVEQAFIAGDFTQSYVSCSLGVSKVGFIFICYGMVDAVCSFLFGKLVQYWGQTPFFVLALLVHCFLQLCLLVWYPEPDYVVSYYVLAAFWGMGDAVIQTQINALYGALFTEHAEAAFANYRLWESAGFAITYAYQNSLKTKYKLYICLAFLGVGMLGYSAVKILQRNRKRLGKKQSSASFDNLASRHFLRTCNSSERCVPRAELGTGQQSHLSVGGPGEQWQAGRNRKWSVSVS